MSALALRCSEVGSIALARHKRIAILLSLLPRLVRVVGGHRLGNAGCIRAEVFLIDLPIPGHDEGHHARVCDTPPDTRERQSLASALRGPCSLSRRPERSAPGA